MVFITIVTWAYKPTYILYDIPLPFIIHPMTYHRYYFMNLAQSF